MTRVANGPVPAAAALQAALAAENAAIFVYGVAGAYLSGSSKSAAEQDWTGHKEARDTLTAMISALGAAPVAAQALYQLPFAVHDASTAMALAAYLEWGNQGVPRPCGGQQPEATHVRRGGHAGRSAARRLLARHHRSLPRPGPKLVRRPLSERRPGQDVPWRASTPATRVPYGLDGGEYRHVGFE